MGPFKLLLITGPIIVSRCVVSYSSQVNGLLYRHIRLCLTVLMCL